ncbi:MAG: hypothetical protein QG620_698 [Patescibacteria group bacterium]|nr:hypothetical protein [Patescibacteria group bacterium]
MLAVLCCGIRKFMDNFVSDIFTYIGIPAIIGGIIWIGRNLILIGRRLQILDDMKISIDKIKHNLKVVCDALVKADSIKFNHEKLKSYSPLNLTDKGVEFIKEIGFDKTFESNKKDFYGFIRSEDPKTPYDIELASIKAVLFLFDNEYFYPVKDYLYNNPEEKKSQVAGVLGVYIRDKYMEDNEK